MKCSYQACKAMAIVSFVAFANLVMAQQPAIQYFRQ